MRKRCFESRADEKLIVRRREFKKALVGRGFQSRENSQGEKESKIQEIVVCSQEEEISKHQEAGRVEIKSK
jgi:hypothetical protein